MTSTGNACARCAAGLVLGHGLAFAVQENGAQRAGSGVRAMGISAFSAIDDDVNGITWNPGGSVQLESAEVSVSGGGYWRRSSPPGFVSQTSTTASLDYLDFALPLNLLGIQQTIGFFWQRQFDFTRSTSLTFGDEFTSNAFSNNQDGSFASIGLSYAIEPLPGLGIGATLASWRNSHTHASHFHSISTTDSSVIGTPIRIVTEDEFETRSVGGNNVVTGIWFRATPELTLAFVYRPAFNLAIETVEHVREHDQDGPTASDNLSDTSQGRWHYPPSATLGCAWTLSDADTVAVDCTWTRWSAYWIEAHGDRANPISRFVDQHRLPDGYNVYIGYERIILFDEALCAARIGMLYEELPSRATSALDNVDPVDPHVDRYFGGSLGASLVTRFLTYDVALQVRRGQHVGTGQETSVDHSATVTSAVLVAGVTLMFAN